MPWCSLNKSRAWKRWWRSCRSGKRPHVLAGAEETVLDEEVLAETEQRVQELRAKIEALGPVNPTAWDEFQEAQQRYDFLNAQRQDLLDSIRDTEKAIHEIDTESRKRGGVL